MYGKRDREQVEQVPSCSQSIVRTTNALPKNSQADVEGSAHSSAAEINVPVNDNLRVPSIGNTPSLKGSTDSAQVVGVTAECPTITVENAEILSGDKEVRPRWYVQVKIGDAKQRALFDPGACRTFMGSLGIQLSTMCGRDIRP